MVIGIHHGVGGGGIITGRSLSPASDPGSGPSVLGAFLTARQAKTPETRTDASRYPGYFLTSLKPGSWEPMSTPQLTQVPVSVNLNQLFVTGRA